MQDYSKDKNIIHFVQNTLGCQCAEEVFNSIELGKGGTSNSEATFTKMVIGNRLLIYVIRPMPESTMRTFVPILTGMGISERTTTVTIDFGLSCPDNPMIKYCTR
jgi:hypothetical protein